MRTLAPGHVPTVAKRLTPLRTVPGTNRMQVEIGVPLRDAAAATERFNQIYDPASPNYHQYLSPAEFTETYGPTTNDFQKVIDFAKAQGMTVTATSSNRLVVQVQTTSADIERAFHLKMQVYQHPTEAREFFAPDREPSVTAGVPILNVGGLNNYLVPRPNMHVSRGRTNSPVRAGTGPNGLGYMGSDFRNAYAAGITNTGTGQSIALVEFDSYYPSDILSYETYAHIPTTIPLNNEFLNGFDGVPGTYDAEVALDIEMSISMAPGLAGVYIYAENEPTNDTPSYAPGIDLLLSQIATDNFAKQISCSWGFVASDATTDNIFMEYAMQGQSFFEACGDSGADVGDIQPPADDPYITQVGGTTLATKSPGGPYQSETVWNTDDPTNGYASSGGVSTYYSIPSWQQGVNMTGTSGSPYQRNFPDVAMVADNVFIVADNGITNSTGGTSCATPLWAGFAALVNQQAVANSQPTIGFINPAIYRLGSLSTYATEFHDVTVGNNTNGYWYTDAPGYYYPLGFCFSEFYAQPGYDLCTGWGSPTGVKLFNALLAPPDALQIAPLATLYMNGPIGGPFNQSSETFYVTNTSASSVNWTSSKTATWLNVSPASGTLGAHAVSAPITVNLNSAANTLATGVYKATVWFSNQVSQVGQARQFTLSVNQPVVANGGFETGDLSYWLLSLDNGYYDYVDDGYYTGVTPHSGSYFMVLGDPYTAPLTTLSQTVATFSGQPYTLSFWMQNPDLGYGTSPNEFSVSWNGITLSDQVNVATISSWQNVKYQVVSSGTTNTLQFGAYNYNSDFVLDDVTLTPIALPKFLTAKLNGGTFTCTWSAVVGEVYQVQYCTSLAAQNWANLGSSFTASTSTITTTDAFNAPRFYRIVMTIPQ